MEPDALSPALQARLGSLDDREIATLIQIQGKLNEGLTARLRKAADTVGGFVW